ncbi:hypothetical protein BMS3Bbin10_00761 [bacterium BMS3Bbin10]|nr:hypothetical protein BMS3Bbin10_00761 [bacterium BMS3Bbin10]
MIEMQQALGLAMSRWGIIEGALSLIFGQSIKARDGAAASAAFAAIHSYEVQIDVTQAALLMTYRDHPDVKEKWTKFRKRLRNLRPKRNKLAHGQIIQESVGSNPTTTRFIPFYHFHHHHGTDAFEKWELADIQKLANDFRELGKEMQTYRNQSDCRASEATKTSLARSRTRSSCGPGANWLECSVPSDSNPLSIRTIRARSTISGVISTSLSLA